MAVTKNMAYDHPAYTSVHFFGGINAAGASAKSCRFAAFTAMTPKSLTATVVVAGTGTGNATLNLVKIAAGGTAITTLGPLITMSTSAAGVTTNVVQTGAIVAGDDVYVQHGADATGVFTIGLELVITPGGSVSP
jgi:hypothetical protein